MRKLLSIILAITMIASFIPAVSAAGETVNNVRIVYNLSGDMEKLGLNYQQSGLMQNDASITGYDLPTITYEATDGFYAWKNSSYSRPTKNFLWYYGTNPTGNCSIGLRQNTGVTFEVDIPVAGSYKMKVKYGIDDVVGLMNVYASQGAYVDTFKITDEMYFGSYTCQSGNKNYTVLEEGMVKKTAADGYTLTDEEAVLNVTVPGKYVIVFRTHANDYRSTIGGFELISGTGADAIIMNGKISSQATLQPGERAQITASGNNSITREALTGWTYSTTDTDIVDVDATTGVVTAKKQGKATITATANGVVNAITTTVNVTQPGVTVKYDISKDFYDNGITNGNKTINTNVVTADKTNGFYTCLTDSVADGNWKVSGGNSAANTNYALRATQKLVFEIEVPVAGKYAMDVNHGIHTGGASAHVLMRAADEAESANVLIGGYDCNDATTTSFWTKTKVSTVKTVSDSDAAVFTDKNAEFDFKAPGKYIITFLFPLNKTGIQTNSSNGARYRISVGTFSLISGDGSQVAIMGGKIAGDSVIREGASATLTASGYNSVTREALTGWTYSTTDTDVVEVNATTGVVTAKAPGTATITAKVNGAVNSVSTTVTVPNENAYTIKYDVSGIIDKFGMKAQSEGVSSLHFSQLDYAHTNGMFAYAASSVNINGVNSAISYAGKRLINMDGTVGRFIKMKINVPVSGKYTMDIDHCYGHRGGSVSVSVGKEIDNLTEIGTYSTHSLSGASNGYFSPSYTTTSTVVDASGTAAVFELEKGEYYIEFKNKAAGSGNADGANKQARGSIGTFKLISGNDTANAVKYIGGALSVTQADSVSGTNLPVSEMIPGTSATVTAFGLNSDMSVATGATVSEVTSSDDSILEVNGNTVTAVGYGTATLSATVSYNGASEVATVEITSVPKETVELLNVVVTSDVPNAVTTNLSGLAYGGIKTYATGSLLKATAAEEIDGYIFRGWKRGSADNGVWLSTNPNLELTLAANTYLTAVYDVDVEEEEEVTVEFYNENGQYLKSADATGKTFDEIKPEDPTRPGYDFAFWATEKDTPILGTDTFKKLTRAVAQFTEREATFTVTGPDGFVKNDCKFNEEIEFTADGEVMWYVDGESVAYGDSYTYYVWSDADITYDAAAIRPNSPIVSIDKDTRDGSYMIHFAGNGYSIVEAGIVFGTNAKIESCFNRAASKKSGYVSGQFSASCDGKDARGYVIYRDDTIYRVVYTD